LPSRTSDSIDCIRSVVFSGRSATPGISRRWRVSDHSTQAPQITAASTSHCQKLGNEKPRGGCCSGTNNYSGPRPWISIRASRAACATERRS
jgi:hypothetical protein